MKKKLKLVAVLIGLALILAGVISIYLKVTSVNTMLNKKHIKIEDETGSYEIIYARDLKRIKMTNKKNVLAYGDNDSFYYEFTEADRKVKKLKVGQTFYGVLPGNSGEVIAAVVEDIQVYEDRVIICGSQPSMADLFDKVDIDATFAADALVIDELAEGVVLEETSLTTASVSDGDKDPERTEMLAGIKWPFRKNRTPKTVPVNHTFKQGFKIKEGAVAFTGTIATTIETVTVSVDFEGGESPVCSLAEVKSTTAITGDLMLEGTYTAEAMLGKFYVDTPIPLLRVPFSLSCYSSITGSVGGSFSYRQTTVNGADLTASLDGVDAKEINQVIDKKVDADLLKFKANLKVGMKATVGLEFCFGVLSGEISVMPGVSMTGEYAPFEPWDEFTESCHDCGVCIDGKISAFAEIAYKVSVKIAKSKPISATAIIGNWSVPLEEFYISFGPEGHWDPRFDLGECPYRRYRTEIKVYNERGEIAGAEVSATLPDGRFEKTYTDEFGYALLWLPDGENTLYAEYNGYINDNHYTVNGAPGKTEIGLDFEQRIFIFCDFCDIVPYQEGNYFGAKEVRQAPGKFPEIAAVLNSTYPQAYMIPSTESGYVIGSVSTINKYLQENDGELRPGDVVLIVTASRYVNSRVTAWGEAGNDYYNRITAKIYLTLNDGTLEMYDAAYGLDWDTRTEAIPDEEHAGWIKGWNHYLTRVYFNGDESVRDYVEFDAQFDRISGGYIYEGLNHGETTYREEDTWYDEEIIITGTEFEHTGNGYIESQVESWGKALIDFGIDCITEQMDKIIVE